MSPKGETRSSSQCYGNYVKKCKSDGSSWNNYYKYCSAGCENGVCEPTCTQGYLDEKRCSKNKIERKYQFSDCSTFWTYYYECEEECYEGRCIKKGPDIFFNLTPIENESSSASYGTGGGQEEGETDFYVTSILDGDTIELNTGDKVRLIGINAPETNQPCWEESASKLIELAYGKQVTLESDFEDKDQYGRLLRYVYVNKVFVNKELLRLGLANVQPYGSNTKYLQQLKQAEQEAKQTNGCLWQSSQEDPAKDKCLKVSNLKFNAAGDDCYNLNDEYVTFSNACNYIVDMTGWTAKDEANHIYIFPTFSLGANAKVTLYTGWGTDSSAQLYWRSSGYSCNAIWNNNGDTLFLRDRQGNLVIAYSYEGFS